MTYRQIWEPILARSSICSLSQSYALHSPTSLIFFFFLKQFLTELNFSYSTHWTTSYALPLVYTSRNSTIRYSFSMGKPPGNSFTNLFIQTIFTLHYPTRTFDILYILLITIKLLSLSIILYLSSFFCIITLFSCIKIGTSRLSYYRYIFKMQTHNIHNKSDDTLKFPPTFHLPIAPCSTTTWFI